MVLSQKKKNNVTLRIVDQGSQSYVSIYQFDMFVELNPKIDPTTECIDISYAIGVSMWW